MRTHLSSEFVPTAIIRTDFSVRVCSDLTLRTVLASEWWINNAAIKPKAIAVATKCKGRRLK
ncbi:MAG: hypothetical protein IIW50_04100, partial [Alistipes sp.]|nr:hypothetical protein [Alistipes sp.]